MFAGRIMKRRTKIFRTAIVVLVIVILALICARIYLPYWLKDHVNQKLAAIPGYSGKVDEIGVSLYRGAYQIHNLKIISDKMCNWLFKFFQNPANANFN